MQRARRNDYWDTFSLYLENTEDPAIKDIELAKKLSDNRSEGEKRLSAVFEKYSKKQEQIRMLVNTSDTSTEEQNEGESSTDNEEDKSRDDLFIDSLSDDDNESEEDIDKTVKENGSLIEKNKNIINNKNNLNLDNINLGKNMKVDQIGKIILSKTKTDMQERCNKNVEIRTSVKENSMTVPESENKVPSEERICKEKDATSNTVLITKNIDTNTKTQEDSSSISSRGCTSTINRIEGL